ncbi:MAG: PAS domain S-box protein, partial [Gammaproteobacteria bacterium]|nr:PAS domain S-box protein [Gammaproteobacteria bacterium]
HTLIKPGQVLLVDRGGRVREIYNLGARQLPKALLTVDERFLSESRVQSYLTVLQDTPYLLVSETVEDGTGTDMGYLVMVAPIDNEFLRASQQGASASDVVIGMLDADEQRFLATSDPASVMTASSVEHAAERFVITAQSFFAYEGSSINLQFVTLIPRSSVEAIHRRVEGVERRQRLIAGGTFILGFTLVFYLLSEWLNRILRRISLFSRRALGRRQPILEKGNQLFVMEDWIKHFISDVLNSREEMRRVHETEMQVSEAVKRAIMEAALDPIVTIDESGLIVEFNSTAERVFGHQRDAVVGSNLVPLIIREDDRASLSKLLARLQPDRTSQESQTQGEMLAVRSNGSLFPVEVSVKPIHLRERHLYTVYLRDITNRKRAEETISSLAKFPLESPSPIIRVNLPGVVIYANPASSPLMEYWGCEQGQTLPLYWRKRLLQVFESGYDWETEVSLRQQTYSLLMTPVIELGYVNIYGRDITELRRAESLAREHQQELVHVCRLSTMGEMATGLAHELNQPLSAIANYANGCARRLQSQPERSGDLIYALSQINTQAERAGEIIRRLRQLVGKQLPVRSVVDINSLVKEVCSFVEFEARKAGVEIEQQVSFDRLPVRGDLVQIEQVLLNLVRNALDALHEVPEDSRSLVIRTGFKGGGNIQIDVVDSGPGISEEVAENLFQPFYTTKQGGMGMGLVISRSIVEDHQGRIEAKQVSNGGSCFSVTLPAYQGKEYQEVR